MPPTQRGKCVLIYGGTFDPPHVAHVRLPFAVAGAIGAGRVVYVPAGRPPHKPDRPIAPAEHRLAMLRLALRERPDAVIETFELDREGPSYTVETLEHLKREWGDGVTLRLLMGADMALSFETWHEPQRIERLAEPVVMLRPPWDRERFCAELPEAQRMRWADRLVDVPTIDASSTALRERIARDGVEHPECAARLDGAVADHIRRHGLYADR